MEFQIYSLLIQKFYRLLKSKLQMICLLVTVKFQLFDIYEEDIQYITDERIRGDIGRKDVRTLIDQVYGYLSLNNLIYGCVTCYDATYFLWRPKRGTLRISDPIYNSSSSNSSLTLLQALYFFVQLVLVGHRDSQQKLEPVQRTLICQRM